MKPYKKHNIHRPLLGRRPMNQVSPAPIEVLSLSQEHNYFLWHSLPLIIAKPVPQFPTNLVLYVDDWHLHRSQHLFSGWRVGLPSLNCGTILSIRKNATASTHSITLKGLGRTEAPERTMDLGVQSRNHLQDSTSSHFRTQLRGCDQSKSNHYYTGNSFTKSQGITNLSYLGFSQSERLLLKQLIMASCLTEK